VSVNSVAFRLTIKIKFAILPRCKKTHFYLNKLSLGEYLMRKLTLLIPLLFAVLIGCNQKTEKKGTDEKGTEMTNEVAVIETSLGRIVLEFYPDVAPNHVENFKKLATEGFYDSVTFHRVIPGFVIQGGCPNTKDDNRMNDGQGDPGYCVDAEFNEKQHLRGSLAMARGGDPNSAGSQFYICVAPQPALNGKYTVFGQVINGMTIVDKIVNVPRDQRDNPLEPVRMESVRIVPRNELR